MNGRHEGYKRVYMAELVLGCLLTAAVGLVGWIGLQVFDLSKVIVSIADDVATSVAEIARNRDEIKEHEVRIRELEIKEGGRDGH